MQATSESPSSPVAGIILAAGKGTRMKSDLPKGLHQVCGLPMVEHIGRAMKASGVTRPIVVIGHGADAMRGALGETYDFTLQKEQLGTGHATLTTAALLAEYSGPVIVAAGDTPMLEAETFQALLKAHRDSKAAITLATCVIENPFGYGRIVRDAKGVFSRIVEQKDAKPEQLKICEVNAALYCFDAKTLFRVLPTIKNTNSQGEYYLTDVLEAVVQQGGKVLAQIFEDRTLLVGVNDRWQLANVDLEMRRRIVKRHAMNGVTFHDIDSVSIGVDVEIGIDTVIEPQTILTGKTKIGAKCHIGPFSRLLDCTMGDESSFVASYAERATIGNKVWVGPYAHLRPHASLGDGVKIGNYVEIKNSQLSPGAKVNHLSYVGDSTVGANTNIGAGTITCNYDGIDKHRTTIGANAFVGSNSTLVAPITIGDDAIIAAGSVVTGDVPSEAMTFGRARQENKEGRATQWRNNKKSSKPQS